MDDEDEDDDEEKEEDEGSCMDKGGKVKDSVGRARLSALMSGTSPSPSPK